MIIEFRFRITFRNGYFTVLFANNIQHALERALAQFEMKSIVRIEEEV